jgi:hypothetical protein
MEIAQEISCRVAIRRTTEKKKLNYDIALRYQEKVLQQYQNQWLRRVEGKRREAYQSYFPPSFPKHDHNESNEINSNRAQKIAHLTGATEQQRLESAVMR